MAAEDENEHDDEDEQKSTPRTERPWGKTGWAG
jgi:hypothetical protein